MCFGKFNTFSLIGFLRSLLPLILGSIYLHKSLFLALVLNTLFHMSYFKGDLSVISFKRLIKAIFLFKGAKNVFLVINCIKHFRLLIIRIFKVKISKNHILRIFLSRGGNFGTLLLRRLCRTYAAFYSTPLLWLL